MPITGHLLEVTDSDMNEPERGPTRRSSDGPERFLPSVPKLPERMWGATPLRQMGKGLEPNLFHLYHYIQKKLSVHNGPCKLVQTLCTWRHAKLASTDFALFKRYTAWDLDT